MVKAKMIHGDKPDHLGPNAQPADDLATGYGDHIKQLQMGS